MFMIGKLSPAVATAAIHISVPVAVLQTQIVPCNGSNASSKVFEDTVAAVTRAIQNTKAFGKGLATKGLQWWSYMSKGVRDRKKRRETSDETSDESFWDGFCFRLCGKKRQDSSDENVSWKREDLDKLRNKKGSTSLKKAALCAIVVFFVEQVGNTITVVEACSGEYTDSDIIWFLNYSGDRDTTVRRLERCGTRVAERVDYLIKNDPRVRPTRDPTAAPTPSPTPPTETECDETLGKLERTFDMPWILNQIFTMPPHSASMERVMVCAQSGVYAQAMQKASASHHETKSEEAARHDRFNRCGGKQRVARGQGPFPTTIQYYTDSMTEQQIGCLGKVQDVHREFGSPALLNIVVTKHPGSHSKPIKDAKQCASRGILGQLHWHRGETPFDVAARHDSCVAAAAARSQDDTNTDPELI